jgi:hypothetical protein
VLGDQATQTDHRCYHFPFFAYEVISACNYEICESLINDDQELDDLFGLCCQFNNPRYETCFGYTQGAIQNLLSHNNSHNALFIQKIKSGSAKYVYPFMAIMNKACSEYMFDIVGHPETHFGDFRETLFMHLFESYLALSSSLDQISNVSQELQFWRQRFKQCGVRGKP